MKLKMRYLVAAMIGAFVVGPLSVIAGTIVDQGNPAPTGRAWPITAATGASSVTVQGTAADGAAPVGNPVQVGGSDGTNMQVITVDTAGRLLASGAAATGAAVTGNPVLVGGSDGTNAQTLRALVNNAAGPSAAMASLAVNDAAQFSGVTTEVLVLTTGTTDVPATPLAGRKSMEIQNLGPNAIFCCLGTAATNCTAAVNTSRQIGVDGSWPLDISDNVEVDCIAATADQLTTNGTIVTEIR